MTTAQSAADRDWPIEQRGVMIAGENPMIVLYRPGSDDIVAIASVWTASWSPAGEGRALVIWADPDATGLGALAPVGIFTDNADLARYVWANFYNDYAPIHGRGIEDTPLRTARFTEQADGQRLHRISCTAGTTTIELEWRDVVEVFQASPTRPGTRFRSSPRPARPPRSRSMGPRPPARFTCRRAGSGVRRSSPSRKPGSRSRMGQARQRN